MTIRLVVADDHEMIRAGFKTALEQHGIETVGEVAHGVDLLPLLSTTECDVALIDVRIPPNDGFELFQAVRQQFERLPVVMCSAFDNASFMAWCVENGAAGFFLKDSNVLHVAEILKRAVDSGTAYTKEMLKRLSGVMASRRLGIDHNVSLTDREVQVLREVAKGATNQEAAVFLKISRETVKEHVQHILQKIGVADRTQAVYWALTNKVIL